jgi:hypothetical protein
MQTGQSSEESVFSLTQPPCRHIKGAEPWAVVPQTALGDFNELWNSEKDRSGKTDRSLVPQEGLYSKDVSTCGMTQGFGDSIRFGWLQAAET